MCVCVCVYTSTIQATILIAKSGHGVNKILNFTVRTEQQHNCTAVTCECCAIEIKSCLYRGADKSLARPERKKATATKL